MRGYMRTFLFLGGLLSATANSDSGPCTGSGFDVDPNDCHDYLQCTNGVHVKHHCPNGLNWNALGNYCDWPANAPCETGPGEDTPTTMPPATTTQSHTTTTTRSTTTTPRPTTTTKATTTTTTTKPPTTTPKMTTKAPTTVKPPPHQDALISYAEFMSAASTKGGNPSVSYYTGFLSSFPKAEITTRREAILFLAHAVWETVGFIYTKEVYCQTHLEDCARAYPNQQGGLQGKVYYGRGMMQLTWDYNYKAASKYLYGDETTLLQNPDAVGENPEVGWATAAWFWHANVHTRTNSFGSTLKAINGALECEGGPNGDHRWLRFQHYKDILSRLGEPLPSDDDGWCTAW